MLYSVYMEAGNPPRVSLYCYGSCVCVCLCVANKQKTRSVSMFFLVDGYLRMGTVGGTQA